MRPHILWSLIWIQTVCKGHQPSSNSPKAHKKLFSSRVNVYTVFRARELLFLGQLAMCLPAIRLYRSVIFTHSVAYMYFYLTISINLLSNILGLF